jgi:Tol biopolymer transport system component
LPLQAGCRDPTRGGLAAVAPDTHGVPARALFALLALLGGLFVVAAASPATASPGGPRLAYLEWKPEATSTRLITLAPDGSGRLVLPLSGVRPVPFDGPAWLPDGSALVFSGYFIDLSGRVRRGARPRLFVVAAEGGGARPLPGTIDAWHPVLSPDGAYVAFKRLRFRHRYDPRDPLAFGADRRATAWIAPLSGGAPRRLTPWQRNVVSEPAAFSFDGSTLLLERSRGPGWQPEIVALDLADGSLRVLIRGAEDPAYSPDGTRLAMIGYRGGHTIASPTGLDPVGDLYVAAADGTRARRLTRTPDAQESQPSWDPGGTHLAFLRTRAPAGLGSGGVIFRVAADGSCQRRVTGRPGRRAPFLHGPAWQPGPGREAGPLSC